MGVLKNGNETEGQPPATLTQCAAHRAQGWLQVGTEDAVVILALCPPPSAQLSLHAQNWQPNRGRSGTLLLVASRRAPRD